MINGRFTFAERWFEGALFLSQDLTRPFFTNLWVPIEDAAEFQSELRILLKDSLNEERYYSEREALGYRVIEWFHNAYGSGNSEVFSSWINNILVLEGPDRLGETLWSALSFNIARRVENGSSTPEWIGQVMADITSFQRIQGASFDDKIDGAEDQELGEWDARLLNVTASSADATMIKVSLIGHYNIFFASWEKHGSGLEYPELCQLWQFAKDLATDVAMDPSDIGFPGVWRFGLPELLMKFARTL